MIQFPQGFSIGATVSAHQVEGNNFGNDWWRWEQRPGRIAGGVTSHPGADHFRHCRADIELAHKLGIRSLVYSIEWSRIEPEPGQYNNAAIDHYTAAMNLMVKCGIEPVCVLNDVTLPVWVADNGGWNNPDIVGGFWRYAAHVASSIGTHVRTWIPILNPLRVALRGYQQALWPPGIESSRRAFPAFLNMLHTHRAASEVLRRHRPDCRVGFSLYARRCAPANPDSAWDLRMARAVQARALQQLCDGLIRGTWRRPFKKLGSFQDAIDFFAVAYDGPESIRFAWNRPGQSFAVETSERPDEPVADGLESILIDLAPYQKPIVVAGTGVPTEHDPERCRFLLENLAAIHRAMRRGSNVAGYYYRSFLDGFEWERGYTSRYGIVHVDFASGARTPNMSSYLLKDIAETGAIRPGIIARLCPGWEPEEPAV